MQTASNKKINSIGETTMSETNNNVETILTEIKETLEIENKVSTELAKSADALVAEHTAKFEGLSKSVDELSAKLDSILNAVAALNIPSQEEIEKAIEVKAEEITKTVEEKTEELNKKVEDLENEPVVKSATVVVEEEVSVEEPEAPKATRQDLIKTAMAELSSASFERKAQLFKAISRLEAGVDIDKVNF